MSLRRAHLAALLAGTALACGARSGWAQTSGGSVIAVPERPPVSSTPNTAVPNGALPAPDLPQSAVVPPGTTGQVGGAGQAASPAFPAAPPTQIVPVWNPRAVAVLDVLDKADGAVTRISAPVGSSFTQGRLRVKIGACVIRPPDMAPDAAVYMTVNRIGERGPAQAAAAAGAGGAKPAPLFRGWLIRSEPGATVVGDAAVTFRLIGCGGN